MKLHSPIIALSCSMALLFFVSCGGGKKGPGGKTTVSVSVSVTPGTATLTQGGTQQFTATVSGSDNKNVTWTLQAGSAGGNMAANGTVCTYQASGTPGTATLIATSTADTTKSAQATITVQPSATESGLNYTNPAAGNNFRFVKNSGISTDNLLVLDLVATGQATASNGLAFSVTLGSTDIVGWAKISAIDTMFVRNGTVFNLGYNPQVLKSTIGGTGNRNLKAVLSQKSFGNPKDLNSGVLARIALELKSGAQSGNVTFTVNSFEIIPATRTTTVIAPTSVAFGTLTYVR